LRAPAPALQAAARSACRCDLTSRSVRTLEQWLAQQESAHALSIDLGLERVTAVARKLGVDRPKSRVITVGGTNGKGSTVGYIDAILRASAMSSGAFTSPHLVRYNERVRVNGVEV